MLDVVKVSVWSVFFVLQLTRVDLGPKSAKCCTGYHMGVEVFEDPEGGEQQIGSASG